MSQTDSTDQPAVKSAKKTTKAPAKRAKKAKAPDATSDQSTSAAAPPAEGSTAKKAAAKVAKKPAAPKRPAKKTAAFESPISPDALEKPKRAKKSAADPPVLMFQAPVPGSPGRSKATPKATSMATPTAEVAPPEVKPDTKAADATAPDDGDEATKRRRRRGGRGRRRTGADGEADASQPSAAESDDGDHQEEEDGESPHESDGEGGTRRRRRRRRKGGGSGAEPSADDPPNTVVHVRESKGEVTGVKGSTRLEAKKARRREGRDSGRRRVVVSEAEFLARRESVERIMVVRAHDDRTQIAVLEDGILVEHYVDRAGSTSMIGSVYLGRVQNVLPSMEAAFVDIGRGRNGVLYAGEVNWDAAGLDGAPRRIESALRSGDAVLVQVTKEPMGHKGARLTSQISLPGRFLVYVPEGQMTGISRKLPDTERSRLKGILRNLVPADAGVIVRTAAEGASEEELDRDISGLAGEWDRITESAKSANAPALLSREPDLAIKVIRDLFNEDFTKLIVSGDAIHREITEYIGDVAPEMLERVDARDSSDDVFADFRVDEQIQKALDRKVWLPSGGSLVIDRTEAMTVIDVNTGKFTGSGGNLEETVTTNNLEAAEEIVRQLRLRDIGGIIVVDFIDMVLESNRDLVLRRLVECLARDRTKHQVAEVTSLGLVQMTRKRIGQGLLEVFGEPCERCGGRGVIVNSTPVDARPEPARRSATAFIAKVHAAAVATNGEHDADALDNSELDDDLEFLDVEPVEIESLAGDGPEVDDADAEPVDIDAPEVFEPVAIAEPEITAPPAPRVSSGPRRATRPAGPVSAV